MGIALFLALDADALDNTMVIRQLGHGVLAAVALFAAAGYGVTMALVPREMAPLRLLLVLPVGAVVSGLALTVLGFAHVPLSVSIGLVVAGGALGGWRTRRRHAGTPHDGRVAVYAAIGAAIVGLALIPSLRAGYATVPGQNPDAHLVTGSALLLAHAAPSSTRVDLPVDKVPQVWQSKYPIFYSLAAVSKLADQDPIVAFPAVAALLTAFVAVGFGLLAVYLLGLSPGGGVLVTAVIGLDELVLHLALHPYWNQLWGLFAMPFALIFAWFAIAERDPRATVLFALVLTLGGLAYPLMLPFPLIAAAGLAIGLRRLPRLPRWSRFRWAVLLAVLAVILAIPLSGAVLKLGAGIANLLDPKLAWRGDIPSFVPLGRFVGTGGGTLPLLVVLGFALTGLVAAVPRARALALAGMLVLAAAADVRLRLTSVAMYVDFKLLSFVGPLLLALAVTGAFWLLHRRSRAGAAAAIVGLLAFAVAATVQTRRELEVTTPQVTASMLELRSWSAALPHNASVRLDIPPSGFQLWAGYFFAEHPVNASDPLLNTTNPHARYGRTAAYSLSLSAPLASQFQRSGRRVPPISDAVGAPLRSNEQFVLRRLRETHGPTTASRRMVQSG